MTTTKIVSPEQIKEMIAALTVVKPKPEDESKREPLDIEIGKAYEFAYTNYKASDGSKMRLSYVDLEEINIQNYYDSFSSGHEEDDEEIVPTSSGWYKPKLGTTCLLCDIIVNKSSSESTLNSKVLREHSYNNFIILIDNKFYLIRSDEFMNLVKEVK